MLKDLSFGQYYKTKSFVHSMDSRVKLLLLIAYLVAVFLVKNFYGFIAVGVFLAVTVIVSRVPVVKILKSLKGIMFLILFTVLLNILFFGSAEGTEVWRIGKLVITDRALYYSAFMALRLILLVFGSSVLTLTTTPVELTDGIESLLFPLKLVKFPVHELALIMSIALRFIPTIAEETERVINAQKARGGNFDTGGPIAKVKAMIPVLIPLLVGSFRRAEELGDAMDARCYNGSKNRTRYKKMKLSFRDPIAVVFLGLTFAAVLILNAKLGSIL